jgi:hypothetical protein
MSAEDKNKDKIIIKDDQLLGVDKSIYDYSYAFSNKVAWTKIINNPYKEYKRTYIELYENLEVGDIIQTFYSSTTYKVLKFQKMADYGRVYKIARTDGMPFVQVDFDNLKKGRKVKIKNRGVNNGMFSK